MEDLEFGIPPPGLGGRNKEASHQSCLFCHSRADTESRMFLGLTQWVIVDLLVGIGKRRYLQKDANHRDRTAILRTVSVLGFAAGT